jgi:hypothetical protein
LPHFADSDCELLHTREILYFFVRPRMRRRPVPRRSIPSGRLHEQIFISTRMSSTVASERSQRA